MTIKDLINKFGGKENEKKELLKRLKSQDEVETIISERKKSANERELERYMDEDREKEIKERLEYMRKKRKHDIDFNHNPLKVENIMNKKSWEVLKEKNMFKNNKNIFSNQPFIFKSNKNLFKNNKKLLKGGKIL